MWNLVKCVCGNSKTENRKTLMTGHQVIHVLTLEALGGGGEERGAGGVKLTPLDFFGFKFLLHDRLSKALAQLFLVFTLSDVISDDVIVKSHAIYVLTAKSQFFARNFTMDSTYFVDFNR